LVLIPFIFLTAGDSPDEIRRGRSLGVEDYLTKPIESADFDFGRERPPAARGPGGSGPNWTFISGDGNVLANTIEGRDAYTHGHVERVAEYALGARWIAGWAPEHLRMLNLAPAARYWEDCDPGHHLEQTRGADRRRNGKR